MRYALMLLLTLLTGVSTAVAGPIHFGRQGFGGHHGPHGGFGGPLGFGGGDTERAQTMFESIFEDIMGDYDDGLASIEDYYSSDEYLEVVDDAEWLVDRYDFFLSSVERTIDRIGDYLVIANDDLTYYNELLQDYQADEDLSEERLSRIEEWITRITECLTDKIDSLTDKQTTLSENITTYQEFDAEINSYLDEIVAAGGGTVDVTDTEETTADSGLAAIALTNAASDAEDVAAQSVPLVTGSAIPEPHTLALLSFAAAWLAVRRRR